MKSGVLNIYKEPGYTSFHAVSVIRKITGEEKVGHTGTLDPGAAGVLPICVGKAVKLVSLLTDTDKTYEAVMKLGLSTDTQDISGNVKERMEGARARRLVDPEKIENAFFRFTGSISQVPPMYSALKVDGVKLVDAARRGKTIERRARTVTVYSYSGISFDSEKLEITFTARVSKGTYIRTLCEDIGAALGVPACLKSLVRTRAAGLNIEDAITLAEAEELVGLGELESRVIQVDEFLLDYSRLDCEESADGRLRNGNPLSLDSLSFEAFRDGLRAADCKEISQCPGDFKDDSRAADCKEKCRLPEDSEEEDMFCRYFKENVRDGEMFRIYDFRGAFCALYAFDKKNNRLKCAKMFV